LCLAAAHASSICADCSCAMLSRGCSHSRLGGRCIGNRGINLKPLPLLPLPSLYPPSPLPQPTYRPFCCSALCNFIPILQLLLTAIVLLVSATITALVAANLLERHTAIQLLGLAAAPPDQRWSRAVAAALPQPAFDVAGAAVDVALGLICGVLGAFMHRYCSLMQFASLSRDTLAGFAVCLGVLIATSCAELQGRGTGDAWEVCHVSPPNSNDAAECNIQKEQQCFKMFTSCSSDITTDRSIRLHFLFRGSCVQELFAHHTDRRMGKRCLAHKNSQTHFRFSRQ
jgi:hypothetical protein